MANETKKNEGPSCACGKVDLYEEMLKNKNNKKKVSYSGMEEQKDDENISTEGSGNQNQKTD